MTNIMSSEALEAKREYERKWRAEHKDKIKAYNAAYWKKKASKANNDTEENGDAENKD